MQGTALSLSESPEPHRDARKAWPRIPHDKYGSAIFIRDDLNVKIISVTGINHVEVITTVLPNVIVHYVYKPVFPPLGHKNLPQIVIGDFYSHMGIRRHRKQRYGSCAIGSVEQPNTHPRCETRKTFNSARWKSIDNMREVCSKPYPPYSTSPQYCFNIYTNDQSLGTAQYPSFTELEHNIEEALDELTTYYRSNSLRAKP